MSIEAFNLQKERCKLAHLNVRGELHGEETVPAIDLKFEFDSANNLLAKLHPDLRAAFYRKDDNRDLVGGDHLPTLKFPLLAATIGWELEVPRTLLRVHTDGGDLVLAGGKTNNFKLTMKEGGTVHWSFRVQVSDPSKDVLAALSGLLQQVVPITLESRDEEEQGSTDLLAQAEAQAQAPKSEARLQAEAMFDKPNPAIDQLPATLATPAGDPDFQEVQGAGQADDVVDAEFTPEEGAAAPAADPIPLKTDEPAANVEPISKAKRGGKRASAGGASLE